MKPISFILCFLFLVSCGKKNTTGSRPDNFTTEPFVTDAEITSVSNTRNGVMVQGTQTNFRIPVMNVTNIFRSRNLVGIIYDNRGLKVKIFNALGRAVYDQATVMRRPRLNVGDDVAAIDFIDNQGRARALAVNVSGKILLQLTADSVRAKTDYGVVAITYRRNSAERAVAMKANGRVLFPDSRNYTRPHFRIDPYILTLSHAEDVERIGH